MNQIAANFLSCSFAWYETIALLLRAEDAPKPQPRVLTVKLVITPHYMACLTYENEHGTNIYVSANPIRPDSWKRTKEWRGLPCCPSAEIHASLRRISTPSEEDRAWVCSQLTRGVDATKLTRELASRRADKPNPLYYAQAMSMSPRLAEGIPIGDVITMLEVRRRFEFPAAIARARAQEIAATQRE